MEEVPCPYVFELQPFAQLGNLFPQFIKASLLAAVDQLQEKEGSEALGKLTATDTDGFSLEELEDGGDEEGEVAPRREGEKDCTEAQVS